MFDDIFDSDRRKLIQTLGFLTLGGLAVFYVVDKIEDNEKEETLKSILEVMAAVAVFVPLTRSAHIMAFAASIIGIYKVFAGEKKNENKNIVAKIIEQNRRIPKPIVDLQGALSQNKFNEALLICDSSDMRGLLAKYPDDTLSNLLEQVKLTIKCFFIPMDNQKAMSLPLDRVEYALVAMFYAISPRSGQKKLTKSSRLQKAKECFNILNNNKQLKSWEKLFFKLLAFMASISFTYNFADNTGYHTYREALESGRVYLDAIQNEIEQDKELQSNPIDIKKFFSVLSLKYNIMAKQFSFGTELAPMRNTEYERTIMAVDNEAFFDISEKYFLKATLAYTHNLFDDAVEFSKQSDHIEARYIAIFSKYLSVRRGTEHGQMSTNEERELKQMLDAARNSDDVLYERVKQENDHNRKIIEIIEGYEI